MTIWPSSGFRHRHRPLALGTVRRDLNSITHEIETNTATRFATEPNSIGCLNGFAELRSWRTALMLNEKQPAAKHCDGLFFFQSGQQDTVRTFSCRRSGLGSRFAAAVGGLKASHRMILRLLPLDVTRLGNRSLPRLPPPAPRELCAAEASVALNWWGCVFGFSQFGRRFLTAACLRQLAHAQSQRIRHD